MSEKIYLSRNEYKVMKEAIKRAEMITGLIDESTSTQETENAVFLNFGDARPSFILQVGIEYSKLLKKEFPHLTGEERNEPIK